jgi:uncharacterized protein (TIGR02118 family)
MYKTVWLFKFKEGSDRDEAERHWREVHGPLFTKIPGTISYTQNLWLEKPESGSDVIEGGAQAQPLPYDGHSECTYEDRAAYERALQTPEYAAMGADGIGLFEYATVVGALVEERVIL